MGGSRHAVRIRVRQELRIGIDKIRAVVVEDSEGICERPAAEMHKSVDTYRDPWQDGARSMTPSGSCTSLPLTALPQVPVR